jgi:dTDP-glucose 4,6-dehydratase
VRILVTGGAGFIGSNFVRRVLSDAYPQLVGSSIVVLDALTYSGNLENLASVADNTRYRFVHGSILDADLLDSLIPEIDAVVHFAAESHVDRSIRDAGPFVTTNVLGTQTLLDALVRTPGKRLVHVSTDEVYGSIDVGSWVEGEPLRPNSPYAASKAASDLLVRAWHVTYGLDASITRCSNNYGPFHFPEKIIPLFITNLLDGLPVPLYGTGDNVRDWLHVDDHCAGIALVLANGRAGQTYNIGGGTELSNRTLADILVQATNRDASFITMVEDRKGHDRRYSVDFSLISTELGYEPAVPFGEGLTTTVQWFEANRGWWEPLKFRAELQ